MTLSYFELCKAIKHFYGKSFQTMLKIIHPKYLADISDTSVINNTTLIDIKQRAIKGGGVLFFRQGVVHFVNIVGNIILARILIPEDFGIYAIISFFINFLILFGDVGFGASLIQKRDEPTIEEVRSVFTFQQILVCTLIVVAFFISSVVPALYHFKKDTIWMFRLMIVSVLFTSYRTIPSARLQRHMNYSKLVLVEVVESLVFQVMTIVLAMFGMGAWSFIIGIVSRSIVGASLLYIISPWPVGFGWKWGINKAVIKFGVPYQGISLVALIKDSINPILIGTLMGASAVGYVSWATMLAGYPSLAAAVFHRLFFATFSRLKEEKESLKAAVEKTLKWSNILVFALLAILVGQAHEITLILFGTKWLPALPLVYFISFGNMFVSSLPLMALLNALGKSHLNLLFTSIWTAGIWIVGYPLVKHFGLIGYGFAHMLVQFTNFALFALVKRLVPIRISRAIIPSVISFILSLLCTYGLKLFVKDVNPFTLAIVSIITLATYVSGLCLFDNQVVLREGLGLLRILRLRTSTDT